jgi:hypothetical protein
MPGVSAGFVEKVTEGADALFDDEEERACQLLALRGCSPAVCKAICASELASGCPPKGLFDHIKCMEDQLLQATIKRVTAQVATQLTNTVDEGGVADGANMHHNVAVVIRDGTPFAVTAQRVAAAGAVALIVVNHDGDAIRTADALGVGSPIPVVMVGSSDRERLTSAQAVTLTLIPNIVHRTLCSAAAAVGHLEVLQWARHKMYPWSHGACREAAKGGHLEVLRWLHANQCPFDRDQCLADASRHNHRETAAWLEKHAISQPQQPQRYKKPTSLYLAYSRLEIAKLMHDRLGEGALGGRVPSDVMVLCRLIAAFLSPILFHQSSTDAEVRQRLEILDADAATVVAFRCCTSVTDDSVIAVAVGCPHLTSLDLSGCKQVTPDAIKTVLRERSQLVSLDLSGCTPLVSRQWSVLGWSPETVVAAVAGCSQLAELNLDGCIGVVDKDVVAISAGCPQLVSLSLSKCSDVTDDGVWAIAACLTQLTSLELGDCMQLTDRSLLMLAWGCWQLISLNLRNCEGVTDEGVKILQTECSQLMSVNLSGCEQVTMTHICMHLGEKRQLHVVRDKSEDDAESDAESESELLAAIAESMAEAASGADDALVDDTMDEDEEMARALAMSIGGDESEDDAESDAESESDIELRAAIAESMAEAASGADEEAASAAADALVDDTMDEDEEMARALAMSIGGGADGGGGGGAEEGGEEKYDLAVLQPVLRRLDSDVDPDAGQSGLDDHLCAADARALSEGIPPAR